MFENKTIKHLEEMLDSAMDGTFVESNYDETRLSRLESRWKEFLGNSVLSNQNLEAERHTNRNFNGVFQILYNCAARKSLG